MKIKVIVRERDKDLWQGEADSVSSTNKTGDFDVLPEHANYVGLIEKFLIVRVGKVEKKWEIERGILTSKEGVVEVYLEY